MDHGRIHHLQLVQIIFTEDEKTRSSASGQTTSIMKEISSNEPFHSGLVKKIVLPKDGKRITNEAVQLTGELLRNFVRTLHQKAAIEAECEKESSIDDSCSSGAVVIRPHHVTKVAAEQLMDYC